MQKRGPKNSPRNVAVRMETGIQRDVTGKTSVNQDEISEQKASKMIIYQGSVGKHFKEAHLP